MPRLIATLIVLLVLAAHGRAQTATPKATGQPMPAAVSRDVLDLQVKIQNLETALRAARYTGAQCDADASALRAQLNGAILTQEGQRLQGERATLATSAKAAGLELVDVLGPDGKPTGMVQFKRPPASAQASPVAAPEIRP